MKKVILSFFFVLLCASYSTPSFAATSEDIMKTFDWNQGKLLDYYWVRPSEIYDQWNNGSRFMRSVLKVSYVNKKDKDIIWKIQESLKDYLNDRPLYWKHELDFHRKLFQNYKKDTLPVFADYKVEERNGTLEIIHREFGFAIGTFETNGKYTSTGYWNNTGGINIDTACIVPVSRRSIFSVRLKCANGKPKFTMNNLKRSISFFYFIICKNR